MGPASDRAPKVGSADIGGRVPRVVMVVPRFPAEFQPYVAQRYAGLLRLGWDVRVACARFDPVAADRLLPEIDVHRVLPGRDLAASLAAFAPDVAHVEFSQIAPAIVADRRARRCPLVVSFHSLDAGLAGGKRGADIYRRVWKHASAIHTVSRDLWRHVVAAGCPAGMPHAVIPPTFDAETFAAPARQHEHVLGGDRVLRIAAVGQYDRKKGYHDAVQAVATLRRFGVACEYRAAGSGPLHDDLERTIASLGLAGTASLLGPLDRGGVRDLLAWADVFLQASVSEGFGVAAVEAQAMGLPVVCTDANGLPEAVLDGETGLVAPSGKPDGLAISLAALARSPALRQAMADRGQRRARAEFSPDVLVPRYDRLYRRLLGGEKPRRG